jgi:tetratricopeptide (TPR) repeat protein
MQPRAFVVMPFNRKRSARRRTEIDFNRVFHDLFEPALRQAGYDVVRADSERSAGDIRTDMFFELVTADLVVADVSVLNGNVFYELGVRHGVCPRGVFVVGNESMPSPPFDIAPDRIFSYDASPFEYPIGQPSDDKHTSGLADAIAMLAKSLKDAGPLDRQVVGSPVYAHLPGLKPVDWDEIETSRAKYFTALDSDWRGRVRRAQALGRPGDILTLAKCAPTRFHESQILYEAAKALVDLARYSAAERVLRDIIQMEPDHSEAGLLLAVVLTKQDEIPAAEHELRRMSEQYKDQPRAANLLGQVFRHLWHLSWAPKPGHRKTDTDKEIARRQQKARDASQLAQSAIQSFLRAHTADPNTYFAGFNALMLAHLLDEIKLPGKCMNNFNEVKTITRYVAHHRRNRAIEEGNYEEQFWTTTTLAGLLFMERQRGQAQDQIRAACAIPAATSYQLLSFRDRMVLLDELHVQSKFVSKALRTVDAALSSRSPHCPCERVFLWAGHSIDAPDRKTPRFPASRVDAVARAIEKILRDCGLKPGDLAICGGTTQSDILFAEICLRLKARVRILMRDPVGRELDEPFWPFSDPEWNARLRRLIPDGPVGNGELREVWVDSQELGNLLETSRNVDPVLIANNRLTEWLINTAEMEAEPATRPDAQPGQTGLPPPGDRLHGLFLRGGHADLIKRVNAYNGYRGRVHTIDPLEALALGTVTRAVSRRVHRSGRRPR